MDEEQPTIIYTRYAVPIILAAPLEVLLQPGFLQEIGVVPGEWTIDTIAKPANDAQEVKYDGGFTVTVLRNVISFNAFVEPDADLPPNLTECNRIVERFLETQSSPAVISFGPQLFGYTMMPEGSQGIRNIGFPLENILPLITFRGTYVLDAREVQFQISESTREPSDFINCLEFTCGTTYSSEDAPDLPSLNLWQAIHTHWATWVENCDQLVLDFYSDHIIETE